MKKYLLIVIYLIFGKLLLAQTVLLHEKISDYDFDVPKRGPNFRHFNHLFIGFALYVPENVSNEIETKPGSTTTLAVGWRYKFKLTNWFAIGAGINYTNDVFNLTQNENKQVPNNIIHEREKLRLNNLGPDFYLRFNFGKRGNVVGRFLDLGGYANWIFRAKDMYLDELDKTMPPYKAGKQRVILSDLDYIEPFHFGVRGRLGLNRFVLTASYRMTDILTQEYKDEVGDFFLPRLNVGLEIGLHK